jgi:hypothetical protein
MLLEQDERFVHALEQIAAALKGIDETRKQEFERRFPVRKEFREAIVTRVPSEEDRIREEHGASTGSLEEWLGELGGEEFIGTREREFLERNASSPKIENPDEANDGGSKASEGTA